jgi:hypothetical protein
MVGQKRQPGFKGWHAYSLAKGRPYLGAKLLNMAVRYGCFLQHTLVPKTIKVRG